MIRKRNRRTIERQPAVSRMTGIFRRGNSFLKRIALTLLMVGTAAVSTAGNTFAAETHTIYTEFYGINSSYSDPDWSYTESAADGSVYQPQSEYYDNDVPDPLLGYYNVCYLMDYGNEDWAWDDVYGSGITIHQDIHLRYECAAYSGPVGDYIEITYTYTDGGNDEYNYTSVYSGDQVDKTTTRFRSGTEYTCLLNSLRM